MKHRLLPSVAAASLVAACWVVSGYACDDKSTAAAAATKSHACTAEMAAKCTPAQAAACKAKGASAMAASGSCCSHSATTAAASSKGVSAVTAVATAACPHGASAKATAAACPYSQGEPTTAAVAGCNKDAKGAMAAGNGYSCSGHGASAMAGLAHGDCDACSNMSTCNDQLKSSGALTQVVKLKNGIMYVYSAQDPGKVHAVQAAIAQRTDRLTAINAAGERAKLCPDCKTMRGAMASGKLNREMVNIEGGCLTLVTSTDASMVAKLHAMIGQQQMASRAKI